MPDQIRPAYGPRVSNDCAYPLDETVWDYNVRDTFQ
jgi:hypothetical protein